MNARAMDRIHHLTVDFAYAARSAGRTGMDDWADWIQDALLPVLEEGLEQARALAPRQRIARLELDLGTVSMAQAPGELARQLAAQLATQPQGARGEGAQGADAAGQADGPASGPGPAMLAFLRSGTVPWTAWDDPAPQNTLLRQMLASPQGHAALGVALRDAQMLLRLSRQFDSGALFAAAALACDRWTVAQRRDALAWAADALRGWQWAGGAAHTFWQWFLPQAAHPASPAALQARWEQACQAGPMAPPPAPSPGSGAAAARFTAAAMRSVGVGLERADFALLAPYWDGMLASAPHCLRAAAAPLRQRWLETFDAATLADILGVLQADCAWVIERLATEVPRARLHALLLPAMRQWLAEPLDSLAPLRVLEWVSRALPEQSARLLAAFGAPPGKQAPRARAPGHAAAMAPLRQAAAPPLSTARRRFTAAAQGRRGAAPARAGARWRRPQVAGATGRGLAPGVAVRHAPAILLPNHGMLLDGTRGAPRSTAAPASPGAAFPTPALAVPSLAAAAILHSAATAAQRRWLAAFLRYGQPARAAYRRGGPQSHVRRWLAALDDAGLMHILALLQSDGQPLWQRRRVRSARARLAPQDPGRARALRARGFIDAPIITGADAMPAQRPRSRGLHRARLQVRPSAGPRGAGPAASQTLKNAPASPDASWFGLATGVDSAALEQVLVRGDVAQLRRVWPRIVMSHGAQFRSIWQQLPIEIRNRTIPRCMSRLGLARRTDLAVMLQPAVAPLMAELLQLLARHLERRDILGTAQRFLLHAEVACVTAAQLIQVVLEQHPSLMADLPPGAGRHIAAALQASGIAPAARAAEDRAIALAAAHWSEEALRAYVTDQQRRRTQFGLLNSAQLHGLVQAWASFQRGGDAPGPLLPAIEARALCLAAPRGFFGSVLQQMALGQGIDLDGIGAGHSAMVLAPMPATDRAARRAEPASAGATADDGASPLSALLRQALPQRLAEAMLRADLSALDAIWPAIVRHHPALLSQAAQRYLGRAVARNRLIDNADGGKMHDLLACLSAPAAQLVAPLLDGAARFSVLLPAPLAPRAFQQRVLRFAFAQVMERPGSAEPVDWLSGLLRSVLAGPSQHALPSEAGFTLHAWYELLRDGDTWLKAELAQSLFGNVYLQAVLRRSRGGTRADDEASLAQVLQPMLMMELCRSHPALTDQLLAQCGLAQADGAVFSAAEWQALAQAQLPRQERSVQEAFWREYGAGLPATAASRGATVEEVQAAFAAAFGGLGKQAWCATEPAAAARLAADTAFAACAAPTSYAVDAASLARTEADAALSAASADTLAILLMRESVPDDTAQASIVLLTQRLLADVADSDRGLIGPISAKSVDSTDSTDSVSSGERHDSIDSVDSASSGERHDSVYGVDSVVSAGTYACATLQSALSQRRAIDRLVAILPGPTLARLLCELQPAVAATLPTVLRAIGDTLPSPLAPVPAMLDRSIWHVIFDAVFCAPTPADAGALLAAVGQRLAGAHAEAEPDWRQQAAVLATLAAPAAAATPAGAMAQLLQPLIRPAPSPVAAHARGDEAAVPFTGESNLRNAGLVLVAPYIERLFAMLDITHDGKFVSEETRQRGVHLLQYVVTGEETTPEYLLALNKLLCGMPAAVPVVLGISMTDKEKHTIEQMLRSVIGHWSAIGSSTVAGLRETFLQREACLYHREEAWQLSVPQATFDMLLDRLPWGYKLIKFSWMAAPLNVTWR